MATGGAAAKLASEYEALWTSSQLLGLLDSTYVEFTPEPLDGGLGVEFCAVRPDGGSERHSVKNETSKPHWSLATLTDKGDNNRSFLGDLFEVTHINDRAEAKFV